MATRNTFGGDPNDRMSNVVSGTRRQASWSRTGFADRDTVSMRNAVNQQGPLNTAGSVGWRSPKQDMPALRSPKTDFPSMYDRGVRKTTNKYSPKRQPLEITVPGYPAKKKATATKKKAATTTSLQRRGASGTMSAAQARGLAPGNYRNKSVNIGGKNYKGFTVTHTPGKNGGTTSVGNWTSTTNAGRSTSKAVGYGGKGDPAGPGGKR